MKQFFSNIVTSFDNTKEGGSARKFTAFALIVMMVYCHVKYVDKDNVVEVLIIDLCGALLCLGLVTAQNIIELKNGNSPNTPPQT